MKLSVYIEDLNRLFAKYGDVDILEENIREEGDVKYYDNETGPYYIDYNGVSGIVVKKIIKEKNY